MSYEEARKVVDKVCKNWEATFNNYKLVNTVYERTCEKNKADLQSLVNDIFGKLTSNIIEAELKSASDLARSYLIIRLDPKTPRGYNTSSYPWSTRKGEPTEKQFISEILQSLRYLLGQALMDSPSMPTEMMLRVAGFIKLIELDLRQNAIFSKVKGMLDEEAKAHEEVLSVQQGYQNMRIEIAKAMMEASRTWYEEGNPLPGEKVVLGNLHTGSVSVKVIRSLSKRSSEPLFRFADGTYVPMNSNRICKFSTWLANNDCYKKIAITLDLPGLVGRDLM